MRSSRRKFAKSVELIMLIRSLVSISLITTCLVLAVGGDVLHQLQHLVADGVCLADSIGSTSSTGHETLDSCSHPHSAHQTKFGAGSEHLNGTHSPENQEPEDDGSDFCTCYVLSQASDTSFKVVLNPNNDFAYLLLADLEQWRLQVGKPSFLVRGPPAFLSHRS